MGKRGKFEVIKMDYRIYGLNSGLSLFIFIFIYVVGTYILVQYTYIYILYSMYSI